jgi:hypothetical protein
LFSDLLPPEGIGKVIKGIPAKPPRRLEELEK